jgi:hypothetical protein
MASEIQQQTAALRKSDAVTPVAKSLRSPPLKRDSKLLTWSKGFLLYQAL